MDVTGDLEVPRHSNEAAPAVEQTNGSTGSNGVASSDADSGGDTGMVPRHVVDELRKKRRDLEVRVEEAEKRELLNTVDRLTSPVPSPPLLLRTSLMIRTLMRMSGALFS